MAETLTVVSTGAKGKRILLSDVSADEKDAVFTTLRECYPDVITLEMRIDPWPVVIDEYGTWRWKEDSMIRDLTNVCEGEYNPHAMGLAAQEQHARRALNMHNVKLAMLNGRYGRLDYLRLLKRVGYSLCGYFDIVHDLDWYNEWVAAMMKYCP